MPGAISNPGSGVIPAAGVQNNLNPSTVVAPSATAVNNALAAKASQAGVDTLATTVAGKATPSDVSTAVSAAIAALVSSAPGALDTLNELASALGNDANFAATIATALASKLSAGNLKTINDQSIVGAGNLAIAGGSGLTDSTFDASAIQLDLVGGREYGSFDAADDDVTLLPADAVLNGSANFTIVLGAGTITYTGFKFVGPDAPETAGTYDFVAHQRADGTKPYLYCTAAESTVAPMGDITVTQLGYANDGETLSGSLVVDLSTALDIIIPSIGNSTGVVGSASDYKMTDGVGLQFPVANGFTNSLGVNFGFGSYVGAMGAIDFSYPPGTDGLTVDHVDGGANLGGGGGAESYELSTLSSTERRKLVVCFGIACPSAGGYPAGLLVSMRCSMTDGRVLADVPFATPGGIGSVGFAYLIDFEPVSEVECSVEFFFNDGTNLSSMFGPMAIGLLP